MKIVLDMFGSDNGPEEITKGLVSAMKKQPDLFVVVSGDADIIIPALKMHNAQLDRIEILDAKEVITNDDTPTVAIRQKKNSSLVVATDALTKRDDILGMVSFGSTGAVLSCGALKLGRIEGIQRPALAPILPTIDNGNVCLIDCGANVDCEPEYLVQFAHMGSAYMQSVFGIENPRVALVSVGVEDKKGNKLTKEVFDRLKNSELNFVGNMEARDALSGKYDVLVCDGFIGNVLLKSIEGTALTLMKMIKQGIMSSKTAKLGAIFMKKMFGELKNTMDYQSKGGAPLLGVKKVLIKGHGAANAKAIETALLQAYTMAKSGLVEKIKAAAKV